MSKPEDIPQRVWDEAHAVNLDQLWACIENDPDDVKLYQDTACIARAILAAEQREREACAHLADKRARMAHEVNHPAAIALLQALPDAIRNRGTDQ